MLVHRIDVIEILRRGFGLEDEEGLDRREGTAALRIADVIAERVVDPAVHGIGEILVPHRSSLVQRAARLRAALPMAPQPERITWPARPCVPRSRRRSSSGPCRRAPSRRRRVLRRSEEHTSELQSLMRISYAVFCLKKKTTNHN